jgi:hypothetical protein
MPGFIIGVPNRRTHRAADFLRAQQITQINQFVVACPGARGDCRTLTKCIIARGNTDCSEQALVVFLSVPHAADSLPHRINTHRTRKGIGGAEARTAL